MVYVISAVNGKNLLPAREYGNLSVILHGGETNQEAWDKLNAVLSHMDREDYLLLIGHPIHIGFAVHIVLDRFALSAQFLVWDRTNYNYRIERITDGKHQPTNATTSK